MRVTHFLPVALDCGCEIRPTTITEGERINCPDHGLAFALETTETVVFSYRARRLDPPDPDPTIDPDTPVVVIPGG